MGCDIHLYVEVKDQNGNWQMAGKPVPNLDLDYDDDNDNIVPTHLRPGFELPDEQPSLRSKARVTYQTFYSGRNYGLFSILADVRNGPQRLIVPISMPKGIPSDACTEYTKHAKTYGSDGHSHSFFTVQELLDYDWTQYLTYIVGMSLKDYYQWSSDDRVEGLLPDRERYINVSYIGKSVKQLSESEANQALVEIEKQGLSKFHESLEKYGLTKPVTAEDKKLAFWFDIHAYDTLVVCPIQIPYYYIAGEFWSQTMPRLLALGKPSDVRIVFFFDN